MSDPIRWLDEGTDALPHERELLEAGRNMDPPPGKADMVWLALGSKLGPGTSQGGSEGGSHGAGSTGNTAAHGSAGSGSASSASSGAPITTAIGSVKAVVVGITSILAIAGVIAAIVMASPVDPARTAPPAPTAASAENPPTLDAEPAKEPVFAAGGSEPIVSPSTLSTIPAETALGRTIPPRLLDAKPVVPAASAAIQDAEQVRKERASRLREESHVLAEARAALRGGDPASALKTLDAAFGRFPDGILLQEREVLAIEALARSHQRSAASTRAAAFLKTYPTSPHATKVRGYVQ